MILQMEKTKKAAVLSETAAFFGAFSTPVTE
jgi:hypothetical protein